LSAVHYVLFYEKEAGYEERSKPWREPHIKYVVDAMQRGDLLMAGSLDDPDDGTALLLFNDKDKASVFAEQDVYVTEGVVTRWYVRRWDTL
jgi:uncharacterized protein YciI